MWKKGNGKKRLCAIKGKKRKRKNQLSLNLTIRNKKNFLEHSSPFYGTWSKMSSHIINGRNPFGKDKKYLDYDVDSEAKWEENIDDEYGETLSEDGKEEDKWMTRRLIIDYIIIRMVS